jgi:hypothetical protein
VLSSDPPCINKKIKKKLKKEKRKRRENRKGQVKL